MRVCASFLIIVGYHADAVQNFFGDGSRYNIHIQYATQSVQDGTGRVVDLARNFVEESPFILSYGDILIDPANYKRLLDLSRRCRSNHYRETRRRCEQRRGGLS